MSGGHQRDTRTPYQKLMAETRGEVVHKPPTIGRTLMTAFAIAIGIMFLLHLAGVGFHSAKPHDYGFVRN